MYPPRITHIRDQLQAECATQTAEDLIHALAGTVQKGLSERLKLSDASDADKLKMVDATLITITDMITGWMGGPNHTCRRIHNSGGHKH